MVLRCLLSCLVVLLDVANAAEPLRIRVLEGDGAINNIRVQRAREPLIKVETVDGAAVSGSAVFFQAPTIGAGGMFGDGNRTATVMTDIEGLAHAPQFRPNRVAGTFQIRVTASYQGQTVSTTISQTNAEPSELGLSSSKKIAILAVIAGAAAGGAALAIRGGGKSGSTSSNGSGAVIVAGSPSLGAP